MRAAVCREFGKPLTIEEVELPPPGETEIAVRVTATAICHSDVHLLRGEWGNVRGDPPMIAGHESVGVVEEVGARVDWVKPGDNIVLSLVKSCGHCARCQSGTPHKCLATFPERPVARPTGTGASGEQIRTIWCGSLAERAVIHQSQAVVIPETVPVEAAALLGCGVVTGAGAVTNSAKVQPGASVVVIGAGGVGLNTIQAAALVGADPIIAVDVLEEKRELARSFGATDALSADEANRDAILARTEGRGADYVFITVGNIRAAEHGLALLGLEGALVLVGIQDLTTAMAVPVGPLIGGSHRLIGSHMGSTRLQTDVPTLVRLYQEGRFKLDELVTRTFSLDEVNDAIETAESGRGIRNVIRFDRA